MACSSRLNQVFQKVWFPKSLLSPLVFSGRGLCQSQEDVILESTKTVGLFILNRPQYLNAMNRSMINKIMVGLDYWSNSKAILIMRALGGTAFCAGSDFKRIAEASFIGDHDFGDEYFFRLYAMCLRLYCLRIPLIVYMDGLTMGAGVGIALTAPFRIATENSQLAFPELTVGFFPDCANAYWLSRLITPYQGSFLALTGQQLKGASVFFAKFATHYIKSDLLPRVEAELLKCQTFSDVKRTLDIFHRIAASDHYSLEPFLGVIDGAFAEHEIEQIIFQLEKIPRKNPYFKFARCILMALKRQCPTTSKVFNEYYMKVKRMTIRDAYNCELTLAKYAIRQPDFLEGVRAQMIDRDFKPKFNPALLEDVDEKLIDPFFTQDCTCTKHRRVK